MTQFFWTHTIWYILLGLVSILELGYVLIKSDNRKLMLALFLTISGILFLIEVQVLAVLKAYDYFPMIAAHKSEIDDSIFGNIFSQLSIAATALLVSFLKLKKYWYVICALLYGGIEELFIYLGIYRHYWYKTWMTIVGFTILLWLMNKVYLKAFKSPGRIYKYACTFFAVYTLFVHLISIPIRLISIPPFKLLLQDEWASVAVNVALNYLPLSNSIMIVHYKRLKRRYHAVVIAALYAVYYVAYAVGYIVYENIRQLLVFATIQILGISLFVHIVDRLYDHIPIVGVEKR